MVHFSYSVRDHLAVILTAIDTKQWVVRNNMMTIEGITNFLNEGEGLPRIRAENIVRTMWRMMLMKMKTRTTMMSRFHNWPFKNCCRSLHFPSLLSFSAPSDCTACFNRAFRIWCTAFVILSQAPPIWHVAGGLEIHLIPLYVQNPLILCWYTHRHRSSPNSSSALVKFFPQSFRICFRRSLRLVNLLEALNIETVF